MTVLGAFLVLLLAGVAGTGSLTVAAAGDHFKTHPTAAHLTRRENHHGSGVKAHQHHARHQRHARTHGQRKHNK